METPSLRYYTNRGWKAGWGSVIEHSLEKWSCKEEVPTRKEKQGRYLQGRIRWPEETELGCGRGQEEGRDLRRERGSGGRWLRSWPRIHS